MSNPLTISLLCLGIFVGNIVSGFIKDEEFSTSMERAFFMTWGALIAYFVIL